MNETPIEYEGRALSLEQALALGREDHNAGRLDVAASIYRQILSTLPEQADAWHLLGVTALQQDQYTEAVRCIEKALAIRPGFARALINLGVTYKALGDLGQAEEVLSRALQAEPGSADAQFNLGTVLQAAGRIAEAAEAYRSVIELEPRSVDALCALGSVLPAIGDAQGAVQVCRKALAIDSKFADGYLHLGNALKALGRKEAAIRTLRSILSQQPDFAEAWFSLADALRVSVRLQEALEAYRRGVALRPDLAESNSAAIGAGQVGSIYRFHLIDKEWCLPPFDSDQRWLLPIDPLIETSRTRQSRTIQFKEICFPKRIASLARYEACDTHFPGIVLVDVPNPCDRKYRLVDGNHRIQKLLSMGQAESSFHVFALEEVEHLIREYSYYITD